MNSTSEGQQPAAPEVGGDSVYSEADVQEKPERLAGPAPVYPSILRQAEIEGEVIVEAIIDTLGRVEPLSLSVVQTVMSSPMWELGGTLAAGDQRSGASPDRAEHHRCAVTPPEERTAPDSFLTCGSDSRGPSSKCAASSNKGRGR